jgi:hypothetical protein
MVAVLAPVASTIFGVDKGLVEHFRDLEALGKSFDLADGAEVLKKRSTRPWISGQDRLEKVGRYAGL